MTRKVSATRATSGFRTWLALWGLGAVGYASGVAGSSLRHVRGRIMGALDRFRLDGKVALITGGTRGLGRVMAQALASAGASVAVSARKADACTVAAEQVANE